jgi:addiction module HigA family antidote
MMAGNAFAPVTPGEILKEEFLTENGLSQNQPAKAIGISPNRIAEIVNNRRRITADTALRLRRVACRNKAAANAQRVNDAQTHERTSAIIEPSVAS